MRLRGLSVREIQAGLEALRHYNPETGAVWSIGTIQSDLTALYKEWQREAMRDINEHKGQINAELNAVKASAWQADDLTSVLRAIDQQRRLLGVDAPQQTQFGGIPGGEPIQVQASDPLAGIDLKKLSIEQLNALESAYKTLDGLRAHCQGESGAQP